MSSIPNLDNIANLSVNKLAQEILVELLPYIYAIIGVVAFICLLLIYICIMVTSNNRKIKTGNTLR
jgi:nucleoside recognition membrane protein YjiH